MKAFLLVVLFAATVAATTAPPQCVRIPFAADKYYYLISTDNSQMLSAWNYPIPGSLIGRAPFGNGGCSPGAFGTYGLPGGHGTNWPPAPNTSSFRYLTVYHKFFMDSSDMTSTGFASKLHLRWDNRILKIWVNKNLVFDGNKNHESCHANGGTTPGVNYDLEFFSVNKDFLLAGENVLQVLAEDHGGETYLDLQLADTGSSCNEEYYNGDDSTTESDTNTVCVSPRPRTP